MKESQGFTLVELVIVVVIIGILAVVGAQTYQKYARRSMGAEGVALTTAVAMAEKIYCNDKQQYYETPGFPGQNWDNDPVLCVDARNNINFNTYRVGADVILGVPSFCAYSDGQNNAKGIRAKCGGIPTTPFYHQLWNTVTDAGVEEDSLN